MKAYITKYALTEGIYEDEGWVSDNSPSVFRSSKNSWAPYIHKPHWHATREGAVARANEMRDKAIKSAQKKIEKLSKLSYETKRN